MITKTNNLPIEQTISPSSQEELSDAVRTAAESQTPVYTIGGGTALDFGCLPTQPGIALQTDRLKKIVEYAPRDMTITLEPGVTMEELAGILAEENQELPIDVPQPNQATIGGVIATSFDAHRRYGLGLIRDYVIGTTAIDGRGVEFHGGGRVVKNVAGYDFCKLLTGSLGTLAVTSQLTLRVRPKSEANDWMTCSAKNFSHAETLLANLTRSATSPVAINLVAGSTNTVFKSLNPENKILLAVQLQGTEVECNWMLKTLDQEWKSGEANDIQVIPDEKAECLNQAITAFPDAGLQLNQNDFKPTLSVKITIPPSKVTSICEQLLSLDPECAILSHAGSGIVYVHFCGLNVHEASNAILHQVRPATIQCGGFAVLLSTPKEGFTRQDVWGPRTASQIWMEKVKQQLDPNAILNPGRFLF